MKAKFTLLVMLLFLTTTIYAFENEHNRITKMAGSFLKKRFERTEGDYRKRSFQRKMENREKTVHLKSGLAIKQKLDSYSSVEWDEFTGLWIPEDKGEFIYDENGNVILESYYEWDKATNQWIHSSKYESTYDANGNIIQENEYDLNENNTLVAANKIIFSYDTNENMTQTINYSWESSTNTFVADWKYEYSYDASGNLIQEIISQLDEIAKQLVPYFKDDYNYNNDGMMLQRFNSYWDKTSGQWILTNKWDYIYNSKGNNVLVQNAYLNGVNQWYDSSKDEFTYDEKGQLIQEVNSNLRSESWIMNYKNNYSYDDFGNVIQNIGYRNWNGSTGQWGDIWKREDTFDNKYNANDLILPLYEAESGIFTHMITEIKGYQWNNFTEEWILDYKTTLAYSSQNVTSIKSIDAEISNVFPNPCSEFVTFNIPDSYSQIAFELFDLQGRKVMSKEIRNNEKVSMKGYRSGMYLYKLYLDGRIQNGKLVKE